MGQGVHSILKNDQRLETKKKQQVRLINCYTKQVEKVNFLCRLKLAMEVWEWWKY